MKRNYPPEEESGSVQKEERNIIEQRLAELYSTEKPRGVTITNKAVYLDHLNHIRLEPKNRQIEGFSQYSKELGYNYVDPPQALYLLESRQLIIFYKELPLSIAEAYSIFLKGSTDVHNYVVFSYLNRNGFFCLPHTGAKIEPNLGIKSVLTANCDKDRVQNDAVSIAISESPLLRENDIIGNTFQEAMKSVRGYGPSESVGTSDDPPIVSLDAYKREDFSRNKPKASKEGYPDFYVCVRDKNTTRFSRISGRNKYLYAIVDTDNSISFIQCDAITDDDIILKAIA